MIVAVMTAATIGAMPYMSSGKKKKRKFANVRKSARTDFSPLLPPTRMSSAQKKSRKPRTAFVRS